MHLQEWTMEEQEQLIHFMTTNSWPYHGNSHPGRHLIEKAIEEGGYESDEVKTFWVEIENGDKVGIVKIYDLADEIPLFDLRIADMSRGNGYGPKALRLVAEYVFGLPNKKIRLEGHTRQDNLAMRKTFERAGFVKEAHLRKAWFSPKENSYYDAVTYGITREDFYGGNNNTCYLGGWGKSADSTSLVFQISQMSLNRSDLSFGRRNLRMQRKFGMPFANHCRHSESGCRGRNRSRSYI